MVNEGCRLCERNVCKKCPIDGTSCAIVPELCAGCMCMYCTPEHPLCTKEEMEEFMNE